MLWDGSRLNRTQGDFFGTGMIFVDFRHVGDDCLAQRGVEDICVGHPSAVQTQSSVQPASMLSGPAAFRGLILDRVVLTIGCRQTERLVVGRCGQFLCGCGRSCISTGNKVVECIGEGWIIIF